MSEPSISQADFERLVAEHQLLVSCMNELEYRLYRLREGGEHVAACQEAAGTLIGLLRSHLFRQDQQVLPILERRLAELPGEGR